MDADAQRRPSRIPFAYFGFAHVCLATAAIALVVSPTTFTGFFYHPRMTAVVHLLTLGWISASILGALPLVASMALRTRIPGARIDTVAFWSFAAGSHGMVSHFWLDAYGGMLWSALLVVLALIIVATRSLPAILDAPIAWGVRLHYAFGFANILMAAALGVAIGLSRSHRALPGPVFENVIGHLHLAAVGWAVMIAIGTAYRLLPMVLPSAVPSGVGPLVGVLSLEVGTLWFTAALCFGVGGRRFATLWIVAGLGVFLHQVVWMLRHRRRPARHRASPDWPRHHAFQALLCLLVASTLGLAISMEWVSEVQALRLAPVYGVLGLLGFLGRLVAGMAAFLVPLASWLRAAQGQPPNALPPAPHRRDPKAYPTVAFWAWTVAVPTLATALYFEHAPLVAVGGTLLFVAIVSGGIDLARAYRHPADQPVVKMVANRTSDHGPSRA